MKLLLLHPASKLLLAVILSLLAYTLLPAQSNESIQNAALQEYRHKFAKVEKQRVADSIRKEELEWQLIQLKSSDHLQKESLLQQLRTIEGNEYKRLSEKKAHIDSLRQTTHGYPVVGVLKDSLFYIYSRIGAYTPEERAQNISRKIEQLYDDDFLKVDSIRIQKSESTYDIMYKALIIMSVSENDALWAGMEMADAAANYRNRISDSLVKAQSENSGLKILTRMALVILVILIAYGSIRIIGKGYARLLHYVHRKQASWLKNLSYKDYTFLTAEQELQVILFFIRIFRWVVYILLLYITLPIIFSIFPFSRNWADTLFQLIWAPFKGLLKAVWNYVPNLFSILVIWVVMKYVQRFTKYIFHEIETEKLKINGFHADWAMPTYTVTRFLWYAFMFILIFPYLPGSESNIFKGVSVFIGILFSLGSSSVITNIVAGIVITYMRPFKMGDRVQIGDVTGDVVEKTLLITRIKTIKNEIITIPNSSVLNGNTTNYSIQAKEKGLIIYTTVTIGYDVPWKDMHQALIDAALRTEFVLKKPMPFVLQTSLDDFYVSYQLNASIRMAHKQAEIYSELHQHIQDVCNERGIEIMSPHYRSARDGNHTTIPVHYLPDEYRAPGFYVQREPNNE